MNTKIFIPTILSVVIFAACAKMGTISGGPKDEEPPVVVESFPENKSLNFDEDKIEVVFNEYIKLKSITNELVVSPPLEKKPNVWLKGKSMMIELKSDLEENTTYTFNFGNAIVDNNEGNILKSYEYVFSTGDYLDSLSVSGRVLNAFTFKPEEGTVVVMLYDSICDSIPYLKIPKYIGKTDKEGYYTINNIKDSIYKVFALIDANNNLLFDNPSEVIAYLDTNVQLTSNYFHSLPTPKMDSSIIEIDSNVLTQVIDSLIVDSLIIDSLQNEIKKHTYKMRIDLLSFEEYHEKQYITNTTRKDRRSLFISLNIPPVDSIFKIEPIYYNIDPWCKYEYKENKDTIICWLTDTSMINSDTLNMSITVMSEDTLGNLVPKTDTINFRYKEKKKPKSKKKEEVKTEEKEFLEFTANVKKKGSILDLNNKVSFEANYPIVSINEDSIKLYEFVDDTVMNPVKFNIVKDSVNIGHFNVIHDWKEETPYMLLLCPNAISGMYDLYNDSLIYRFSTQLLSTYGTIILNIENITSPVILLLMNSKEDKIFSKRYLNKDQSIHFKYLKPGEYFLKIIFDDNENNEWDTGNYLEKKQPEGVTYFKERIDVRSNWDIEQEWYLPNNPGKK